MDATTMAVAHRPTPADLIALGELTRAWVAAEARAAKLAAMADESALHSVPEKHWRQRAVRANGHAGKWRREVVAAIERMGLGSCGEFATLVNGQVRCARARAEATARGRVLGRRMRRELRAMGTREEGAT